MIFFNKAFKIILGSKKYFRFAAALHALKNFFLYVRVVSENKNRPLTDISALSREVKPFANEVYLDNANFGISRNLKQFSGYRGYIHGVIEHGLFLYTHGEQEVNALLPKIITFGDFREEMLKKVTQKEICKIGPYIHYAEDYYDSKRFAEEKGRLGRVLLVFPSHSTEKADVHYEMEKFTDYIESARSSFDTVMVCLFFADILRGRYASFLGKGYQLVTAGSRYDPYFLSRLKTIIKLSDHTVSNSVGTHIGYCVFLGKPHYLFQQNHRYSYEVVPGHDEQRVVCPNPFLHEAFDEISSVFGSDCATITPAQLAVLEKYWGMSHIKSAASLKCILE